MIQVTKTIHIDENELRERFLRSSGPGGQNVNKVATAVQLRFDVRNSRSLPDEVRERLVRSAGNRMTGGGVLVIEASRFRTRERNRKDARDRLVALIRKSAEPVRRRKRTDPPGYTKEFRLESKRRRSEVKKRRGRIPVTDP